MAAHTASCIRRSYPDAFLGWAVESRCAPVVDTAKLVDLKFEVPRDKWKRGGPGSSWLAQMRYFASLRQYRFDTGIDLQGHSKTAICLRLSGARRRVAVRATDFFAGILNPRSTAAASEHVVDRQLEVLRRLGNFSGDSSPVMPDVRSHRPSIPSARPLATITVSTGNQRKNYPVDRWRKLGELLQSDGYHVAYLGGPGDPVVELPGSTDWVGKLPLEATMAAVEASAVHFAGDTGTGHIAAAYGVPVVSVFIGTDPAKYRPYTSRAVVLQGAETTPEQLLLAGEGLVGRKNEAVSR